MDIPEQTKLAIDNYVSKGDYPGDFVMAVLANDLRSALSRADHINLPALKEIVGYVVYEVPVNLHGSYDDVYVHLINMKNEAVRNKL